MPAAGAFPFFEPMQPPRSLQVMAHRGAAGLAPENTAGALEASIADTVEWVEVDVRLTRDGHHVLFHDDTLERQDRRDRARPRPHARGDPPRSTPARSSPRRFAGERVLTLAEALGLARGRVNLYLDCKDVDPAPLAREVLAAKMGRQVVVYDESRRSSRPSAAEAGDVVALMTKWRPAFGLDRWAEELRPARRRDRRRRRDPRGLPPSSTAEGSRSRPRRLGGDDRPEVWDRVAAAGVDWVQTDRAEEILARPGLEASGPAG